jgi:hypothetical protein
LLVTHQLRTTLRSVQIAEKSNEIPAVKPLLTGMSLQDCAVTADAMHCQQETARFISQDLGGGAAAGASSPSSASPAEMTTFLPFIDSNDPAVDGETPDLT